MTSSLKLAIAVVASWTAQEASGISFLQESRPIEHPKEGQFTDYLHQKGRVYSKGSTEYDERFALFLQRSEIVEEVNNHPHKTWKATLNHFADRTEHELKGMLGYKRSHRAASSMSSATALKVNSGYGEDFLERASVDWSQNLSSLSMIRDQGSCGSCWAVTATTVLDAHAQNSGRDTTFATQEVVDCVPNPNKCGGSGGCDGATVELAFQYAMLKGLRSPETYGSYTAMQGPCSWEADESTSPTLEQLTTFNAGAVFMQAPANAAGTAYGMTGWERLDTNVYHSLMKEVTESGPVAIALVASTFLFLYSSGIFDDCDWTVNHAVTLIGYGAEGNDKYWLIQNSWGPQWGEQGRLRIARKPAHLEQKHCGEDTEPQQGIACENETDPVRVCGTCGVLFDSVVPRFMPH